MSRWKIVAFSALTLAFMTLLMLYPPGKYRPRRGDGAEYRSWTLPRREAFFVQLAAFETEEQAQAFAEQTEDYVRVLPGAAYRCLARWYPAREQAEAAAAEARGRFPQASVYEAVRPRTEQSALCARRDAEADLARDQALWDAACAAQRAAELLERAPEHREEARRLCLSALAMAQLSGADLPDPFETAGASNPLYEARRASLDWVTRVVSP